MSRTYGLSNLDYAVPVSAQTRFEAGSVTKQFVAAALLMLVEEGRLSLDDDARPYVPELPDRNIHVSNTLANIRGQLTPYRQGLTILASADQVTDPHRRYVCGYLLRDWAEQVEENRDSPFRQRLPTLTAYTRDLRALHRAGVPLLFGSDAGVMFVYPGFSLHDELEMMVNDAGFSPMDVLRIATAGVPAYFGRQAYMGAVEPGQAADLVLLDADPLADIRNVRRIRGVMAQGRWLDRTSLDALLADVERDARGSCQGGSRAGRSAAASRSHASRDRTGA